MAGSEPRSGGVSPQPHHSDWGRLEAAILSGWRNFWQSVGKERAARSTSREEADEEASTLTRLPIDVQLYILSFLSPHDLCQLGSTSHYWNETVRDPILWRYFLLRDLPSWSSVDWKSLPDLEILKKPISEVTDGTSFDYMAVYKMCCPYTRRSLKSSRPMYGAVTSFLHSLIIQNEPRFAMFGPGLEELNTSLVLSLMSSEELCPTAGLPQRQIDGIGSGVSFQLNNQHKFNILILYSTTRKERDRAREEHTSAVNKMFSLQNEGDDQQGSRYSVIPQIQKVCEVVDGFIYVANAEAHKTGTLVFSSLQTWTWTGTIPLAFLGLQQIPGSRLQIFGLPSVHNHVSCLEENHITYVAALYRPLPVGDNCRWKTRHR
ncbi:F-box only protein 4 isoform X9 [Pteropus medius]|uniref:F-box only protein 4 isoform X9 n=1 Tax=Pteropus vampyrus TaxID=132908 RepID=UPI00196AE51F|nr:F-box only protein 4 isoform X9 [Pteropus giganteus]